MSPKELLYIEDALSRAKFLQTQCQQTATSLTDMQLKNAMEQMATKHQNLFNQFYGLV